MTPKEAETAGCAVGRREEEHLAVAMSLRRCQYLGQKKAQRRERKSRALVKRLSDARR